MGWYFDISRIEKFPTQFAELKTPVTVDVLETGFILAFVILALCFYIVMPSSRGSYRWDVFVRVTVSLLIGVILMTSNFGQSWEVGHVSTPTPYKAGEAHEINASIGLKLGLRSLNVTLVREVSEDTEDHHNPLAKEIINYNERFWWTWDQGRFGFGPYAGTLQQSFRQAQLRGLPLPILWVVDYFTWDGEGLRFGRYYRTAGWYTHIAMWTALPCWMAANFLFLSVIRYGAFFTILTGALQLLACILWVVIRNPIPLVIPFEGGEITMKYGIHFWLTLTSGFLCMIIGLVIVFLDLRFPDDIADFFGIDPLSDYEEYHLTATELDVVRQKGKRKDIDMIEMANNSEVEYNSLQPPEQHTQYVLQRSSTVRQIQKALIRTPATTVRERQEHIQEDPVYDNLVPPGYNYRGLVEEDQRYLNVPVRQVHT